MARDEWMNILYKVKSGELSIEEAERLLQAVDEQTGSRSGPEIPMGGSQNSEKNSEEMLSGPGWWKNAWMVPVWVGIGIMVLSAWLLTWGYTNERLFWFYCSWLPLVLGILVFILGAWSRQARWVHIRIHDSDGPKISFSLPLPIRLASWALRIFAPRIPELKGKHIDQIPEILDAIGDSRDPISVEVDDDEDGNRVRIYIL